jgi:hypothetical protein
MALPETVVVRRKDVLEHLGVSTRKFYELVKAGAIPARRLKDKRGKPRGKPLYLRSDVLRFEETLKT